MDIAIAKWAKDVTVRIFNMAGDPKRAWEGIKTLQDGLTSHHKSSQTMKFKRENGCFTKNDKEHIDELHPHFHKVFNCNPAIDKNVFSKVHQYETMESLDESLTFEEFKDAIKALSWHKAPGLNKVVPNAIKALNDENLAILYTALC